jgi:hypothetical protein
MALMFQVEAFWDVTPCSVAVGLHFGGPCCLYNTTRSHKGEDLDLRGL